MIVGLLEVGYRAMIQELTAEEFGVPQSRGRLYIIAVKFVIPVTYLEKAWEMVQILKSPNTVDIDEVIADSPELPKPAKKLRRDWVRPHDLWPAGHTEHFRAAGLVFKLPYEAYIEKFVMESNMRIAEDIFSWPLRERSKVSTTR